MSAYHSESNLLNNWFAALQAKDYSSLFKLCALTWQSNHSVIELAGIFSNRVYSGYSIINIAPIGDGFNRKAELDVNLNGKWVRLPKVMLIREKGPYNPLLKTDSLFVFSQMGVNPISFLRTDESSSV